MATHSVVGNWAGTDPCRSKGKVVKVPTIKFIKQNTVVHDFYGKYRRRENFH